MESGLRADGMTSGQRDSTPVVSATDYRGYRDVGVQTGFQDPLVAFLDLGPGHVKISKIVPAVDIHARVIKNQHRADRVD